MWQYFFAWLSTWYYISQYTAKKPTTQMASRGSWERRLLCAYVCLGPQGPEASAGWGGGGAVWGHPPRSSQPGQWLLWQGGLGLAPCFTTELACCVELWYKRFTAHNGVFNEIIWSKTCLQVKKEQLGEWQKKNFFVGCVLKSIKKCYCAFFFFWPWLSWLLFLFSFFLVEIVATQSFWNPDLVEDYMVHCPEA